MKLAPFVDDQHVKSDLVCCSPHPEPTDLAMKIGIISDTHDHVKHIEAAVKHFKDAHIDMVLHAGDYCSPFSVLPFSGLQLIGVFGNNDGDHFRLIQKFSEIGGEIHNEFYETELDGRQIALYHGTQPSITDALIKCGSYDLVITGHTHTAGKQMYGRTMALNPGAAHGFGRAGTYAEYDCETGEADIREILLDS